MATATAPAESKQSYETVYDVIPLIVSPKRSEVFSHIVRRLCEHETVFSDFQKGCEQACYKDKSAREMCKQCQRCFVTVMKAIGKSDSRVWEIWRFRKDGDADIVGILRLSRIAPGQDAVAHYAMFDGKLSDKTNVLRDAIEWTFTDHEEAGWKALRRLTVEIPSHAYALARHAYKKLGFAGPYFYALDDNKTIFNPNEAAGNKAIHVEGVKRKAVLWRGEWRDILIMGLLNKKRT